MKPTLSDVIHMPQAFVDRIGMYRVVTGSLALLALISILTGFLGIFPYSGTDQLTALTLALATALLLNVVTAKVSRIDANHESAIITAFILFFLAVPGEGVGGNWPLVAAVAVGVMSKYVLVYKKQHIVNPAAFGALAISLPGFFVFSWWVANPTLFIPLLILGVLVVMKVRKWVPVTAFIAVGLATYLFEAWRYGDDLLNATEIFFVSWPTLFLAAFMLTEPFTTPPLQWQQASYGALVGFLSNTTLLIPLVSMSPELALVVGNLAVAPLRLSQKLFLQLEEKKQVAKDTYEFVFKKPKGFNFIAGQYLEWMLPHEKSDQKGVRRYFTIASSPTEPSVRVAMKIPDKHSSYKKALTSLDIGKTLIASQLAGDFLLPKEQRTKVAFIAGGIGVTPFRSHIKYMIDSDNTFDTALYYCVNTSDELAYKELWDEAKKQIVFSLVPVVAKEDVLYPSEKGYITTEMIRRRTPDYKERTWYISGPPGMVNAYKKLLKEMGVKGSGIKTDFFPGAV